MVVVTNMDTAHLARSSDLTTSHAVDRVRERTGVANTKHNLVACFDYATVAGLNEFIQDPASVGNRLHPHNPRRPNVNGQWRHGLFGYADGRFCVACNLNRRERDVHDAASLVTFRQGCFN